jgi:pyruvate/2-oxoglutarate dehydrogenase complex dihydrolipoamide dehydrogenase (E3) component
MEATGSGQARALLAGGPVIEAEQVILAAGRTPATAGLGLDAIGITPDDTGALAVDPRRRLVPAPRRWQGCARGR